MSNRASRFSVMVLFAALVIVGTDVRVSLAADSTLVPKQTTPTKARKLSYVQATSELNRELAGRALSSGWNRVARRASGFELWVFVTGGKVTRWAVTQGGHPKNYARAASGGGSRTAETCYENFRNCLNNCTDFSTIGWAKAGFAPWSFLDAFESQEVCIKECEYSLGECLRYLGTRGGGTRL